MEEDLKRLKFNLQEEKFPYFSDEELTYLLEEFKTVKKASYEGCLIKAYDDSVNIGPIATVSNEQYWLRRAMRFRTNNTSKGMRRADDV